MKSIRGQLTLALVLGGAALLAILCVAAHRRASALLTAQFDDGLRARSAALVSLLRPTRRGMELDYKDEYMPEYEHAGGSFAFEVWTNEETARVLERSQSLQGSDLPRFGRDVATPMFRDFTGTDGRPWRAAGVRVTVREDEDDRDTPANADGKSPDAFVVVAGETTALRARLNSLATELALGGLAGLGLLALMIRMILRRGLAPLARVSNHAAQLEVTSLGQPFPTNEMPAELAPICTRLNQLLARLNEAFSRERRFSADVAHELRTPIAELRTLSEVGAKLGSSDLEHVASFFQDTKEIAGRMERTVATLLMLARCESGRQTVELSPLDLKVLMQPLCATASAEAQGRKIRMECEMAEGARIESDRELLSWLLRIFLENAIEYTAPNGVLSVTADERAITIRNGPTNLESTDLPHLFERFWRKDRARTDERHAGLGLALAAELARLLKARVATALSADRVFQISVTW